MKSSNWWGTKHADKGGEDVGGWGGIGGRQPNKKKCKRPQKATWGGPGAAAQLSRLESVALIFWLPKRKKEIRVSEMDGGNR